MAVFFYDVDNTYPNIAYSTGWNEYSDPKAYGGSVMSTFNQATASFNFTGMAVSVQCDKLFDSESNDSALFNVDNGPWSPIIVSDSTEPYTCWSSGSLGSEGTHILNVKNVVGGTPLRIDKITYMVYVPETFSSSESLQSSTTTEITASTSSIAFTTSSIPFATSSTPFTSASPTVTDTLPSSTPSSLPETVHNMATPKNISIAIMSLISVFLGLLGLLAYMKRRRSRNAEAIFNDDISYLPTHHPELTFTPDLTKQPGVTLNHFSPPVHHLSRPQPTYAIPTRDGNEGIPFPPRRPAYDLESNVPPVMAPKRSRLRDTIIFPRLSRHPVQRSARI